ncbi:MAG: DUF11 domain-containing protein [Planctomycetaceae bacterium]|nr:DUF11 domain-containing protein [Planctomycetaceae bacterium]
MSGKGGIVLWVCMVAIPVAGGCGVGEAVTIELSPRKAVNPIMTQHVLVATVKDSSGCPLAGQRVEWIIPEGSMGTLVEVDGSKVTGQYAVTHTGACPKVLTRGNDDPADDVRLSAGQTWAVVTSPVEGATNVVAYAPGIRDWNRHKVFAVELWYDVKWDLPRDGVSPAGDGHSMLTRVRRHSDGAPLSGYTVEYRIVSGPEATLNGAGKTASVRTDEHGQAQCTIKQAKAVEGANEISVDIMRPAGEKGARPEIPLVTGSTRVQWIGAKIAITKNAPAQAKLNQEFTYTIVVSNPSQVEAQSVIVADALGEGIKFVSSDPEANVSGQNLSWNLGSLNGGATRTLNVRVKATRGGSFKNCGQVTAARGLSGESCATTVVSQARVKVTQRSEPAVTGKAFTATVSVTNSGESELTGVRVQETLPEGLTLEGSAKTSIDVGTLAPGASRDVTYHLRAQRGGTYTIKAVVTANEGAPTTSQSTITVKTQAAAPATQKSKEPKR